MKINAFTGFPRLLYIISGFIVTILSALLLRWMC